MNSNLNLEELRKQLDDMDADLVALYEKRLTVCQQVALYKQQTGKPILDEKRESEKLTAVRAMAKDEKHADAIEHLFQQIMTDSRDLQSEWMRELGGETT